MRLSVDLESIDDLKNYAGLEALVLPTSRKPVRCGKAVSKKTLAFMKKKMGDSLHAEFVFPCKGKGKAKIFGAFGNGVKLFSKMGGCMDFSNFSASAIDKSAGPPATGSAPPGKKPLKKPKKPKKMKKPKKPKKPKKSKKPKRPKRPKGPPGKLPMNFKPTGTGQPMQQPTGTRPPHGPHGTRPPHGPHVSRPPMHKPTGTGPPPVKPTGTRAPPSHEGHTKPLFINRPNGPEDILNQRC